MSSYIVAGKPLEYDNAPDWLVAHMRYRRTVLGNTPTSVMTFFKSLREFFQWYSCIYNTGAQPQTEKALRETDILALPFFAVLEVKKADIESYLYFLTDVLGNDVVTRNKKLVTIRGFYEYVIDQADSMGIEFEVNPAARVKSPKMPEKQPVYLPQEDQEAFLAAITGENGPRDYALFLMLLSTGMRISEAVNVNMGDLNLDNKLIRIRSGKGSKSRTANLTEPCCQAIRDYLEEYRDLIPDLDTDALFVTKRFKTRLTARSAERAMEKYVKAAKLGGKGYTPHKLRHTTATMLAKDGEDLQIIQRVLGHERPDTTEIYTHLDNSDVARAVNRSSLTRIGVGTQQEQ